MLGGMALGIVCAGSGAGNDDLRKLYDFLTYIACSEILGGLSLLTGLGMAYGRTSVFTWISTYASVKPLKTRRSVTICCFTYLERSKLVAPMTS